MKNFFKKILSNPLLSFVFWMLLLSTKLIINNNPWGTIVELGGALIFVISLANWVNSKKTSKPKDENNLK